MTQLFSCLPSLSSSPLGCRGTGPPWMITSDLRFMGSWLVRSTGFTSWTFGTAGHSVTYTLGMVDSCLLQGNNS